eukprot:4105640-Ditylum_brightwellii.AAC.1
MGWTVDYNKHCWLPYGTYAHTHESHNNNMEPMTVGVIAMGPTGNTQLCPGPTARPSPPSPTY